MQIDLSYSDFFTLIDEQRLKYSYVTVTVSAGSEYIIWSEYNGALLATVANEADDIANFEEVRKDIPISKQQNRKYRAEQIILNTTTATGWQAQTRSWPHDIWIIGCKWRNEGALGDELRFIAGRNIPVGNIGLDIAIGSTQKRFDDAAVGALTPGDYIDLDDGVNTERVGRVRSINYTTKVVKWETATANAYLAATPTQVLKTSFILNEFVIRNTDEYKLTIPRMHLPAGEDFVLRYNNKSAAVNRTRLLVEYVH